MIRRCSGSQKWTAAGLVKSALRIEDIVDLTDARAELPKRPAKYKPRQPKAA
jgi:hypothetical protein